MTKLPCQFESNFLTEQLNENHKFPKGLRHRTNLITIIAIFKIYLARTFEQ